MKRWKTALVVDRIRLSSACRVPGYHSKVTELRNRRSKVAFSKLSQETVADNVLGTDNQVSVAVGRLYRCFGPGCDALGVGGPVIVAASPGPE